MRDFRFSCNVFGVSSRMEFVRYCQDAERFGYSTLFTADHLGSPAPFTPLVLAAQVTDRLRVGTMVLNVPFWNAHLLAREVATADVLTDGRFELGLGAGHMKWEFDAARIAWPPLRERVGAVAATVDELERIFGRRGYPERRTLETTGGRTPLAPVQRTGLNGTGPPLIIGGTGDRISGPGGAGGRTPSRSAASSRPRASRPGPSSCRARPRPTSGWPTSGPRLVTGPITWSSMP